MRKPRVGCDSGEVPPRQRGYGQDHTTPKKVLAAGAIAKELIEQDHGEVYAHERGQQSEPHYSRPVLQQQHTNAGNY